MRVLGVMSPPITKEVIRVAEKEKGGDHRAREKRASAKDDFYEKLL